MLTTQLKNLLIPLVLMFPLIAWADSTPVSIANDGPYVMTLKQPHQSIPAGLVGGSEHFPPNALNWCSKGNDSYHYHFHTRKFQGNDQQFSLLYYSLNNHDIQCEIKFRILDGKLHVSTQGSAGCHHHGNSISITSKRTPEPSSGKKCH